MLGSVAVQRVNDGLMFRPDGHNLESKIVLRFAEAQRELEKGKTLPRFLLQEGQTLSLVAGTSTVALPTGFIRESDDSLIRYTPSGTDKPTFLERRYYRDAIIAQIKEENDPVAPSIYVIRRSTIDFITTADTTYTLTWDYYKAADAFSTSAENAWLANAPEWLIGECGVRIAADLRDADAVTLFMKMRDMARMSVLGEDFTAELASGPIVMGANL